MPINIGDRVVVTWGHSDCCEYMALRGTVTHVPSATGDLWGIDGEDGNSHGINPGCVNFCEITQLTPERKEREDAPETASDE